jgi:hypothetical protein
MGKCLVKRPLERLIRWGDNTEMDYSDAGFETVDCSEISGLVWRASMSRDIY